jgi:hypothetical protein
VWCAELSLLCFGVEVGECALVLPGTRMKTLRGKVGPGCGVMQSWLCCGRTWHVYVKDSSAACMHCEVPLPATCVQARTAAYIY